MGKNEISSMYIRAKSWLVRALLLITHHPSPITLHPSPAEPRPRHERIHRRNERIVCVFDHGCMIAAGEIYELLVGIAERVEDAQLSIHRRERVAFAANQESRTFYERCVEDLI